MRRLFWFSAGAAAGYYVARRGERVVLEARERGLVGNVTLVAGAATRLAQNASVAAAGLGDRTRPGPTPTQQPRTIDLTHQTEGRP